MLGRMADGLIPTLAGLALSVGSALLYWHLRQREAGHWPERDWVPTPAEIVESRLEGSEDPYQPHVRYRYQAGGRERIGRRLAPLNGWGHDEDKLAEQVIARYPVGLRLTAYVNPANPDQSVLVRKPAQGELSNNLVATVVAAFIGILLLLFGLSR